MFLKDLKEKPQKILFLELAALIMMAEGSQSTTSERIQELEPQSKRYALIPKLETESKKYACFQRLESDDRKYVFLQNIDENEINALDIYAKELEIKNIDGLFSCKSGNNDFEIINVLKEEIASVLNKYSQLDEIKEEIILNNFSNRKEDLNINTKAVEDFILTMTSVKKYILERTANKLISIRQKAIGHLDSKEKRIILFELIEAAYSSGNLENLEKLLLLQICKSLDIESEYIDEFLEVSERLFLAKKDLTILINE